MAGLWPFGAGTIRLPPHDTVMFLPQRPNLPLGSLRASVSYPAAPSRFDQAFVTAALERVGLGHLLASLDREARWDQRLSVEEHQRLAFARLLLHRPRWVVLDDALSALDEEHRQWMQSFFENELADTAVVSIGRSPARNCLYGRTLYFHRLDAGAALVPLRPRPRSVHQRPTAPRSSRCARAHRELKQVDVGLVEGGQPAAA
jgi:putative ATP-binding cassette transporter